MTRYYMNGKEVSTDEFLKNAPEDWMSAPPMSAMTYRDHDPLISESTGVLPNQVAAERKKLRKLQERGELTGVSIQDNGAVAFTSRGERGRIGWMRYRGGKVDREGGYGDTYTPDDRFGDG